MTKKFKSVALSRDYTIDLPEDQILLCFADYEGAIAFYEWWENSEEGRKAFAAWLETSEYADLLDYE